MNKLFKKIIPLTILSIMAFSTHAESLLEDWTWNVGASITKNNNGTTTISTYYYDNIPSNIKNFQLFIDSIPNKGFNGSDGWEVFGADYLIENTSLYSSQSDTQWKWKYLGEVSLNNNQEAGNKRAIFIHDNTLLADAIEGDSVDMYVESYDKDWVGEYFTIPLLDIEVTTESTPPDGGNVCTTEYAPVCGIVQVQCVTTPCEPIEQTFPNRCNLDENPLAEYLREGECTETSPPNTTRTAPYNLPKFQSVLNQSKLQWPQSSTEVSYGDFQGFQADHFYLSSEGYLTFETEDSNVKRVELRQGPQEWKTSTSTLKNMVGELKCFHPETIKEYSWMQIHDNSSFDGNNINKPFVRLAWRKLHQGQEDHLWAIIRTSHQADGSATSIDLGKRPDSFFKAEIAVQNNQLVIKIDGVEKITQDVRYWEDSQNYFKAGVYLSGSVNNDVPDGQKKAKVQFKSLSYDSSASELIIDNGNDTINNQHTELPNQATQLE